MSKNGSKSILHVAIMGFGRMGRFYFDAMNSMPNASVVAVWKARPLDKQSTILSDCPKWSSNVRISNNAESVISAPDVDAVVISSATDMHVAHIDLCIKHGKPFFCEKPLSVDFATGEAVKTRVLQSGLFNMIGFHKRFDLGWQRLRRSVGNGGLPDVSQIVSIGTLRTVHVVARDIAPPTLEYARHSGGLFMDMTIHDFDIIRYLTGMEVTEVYATGSCLVSTELEQLGDIDTANITLKFQSGVMATIHNCRQAVYGLDQRGEVFGSKGMVCLQNQGSTDCMEFSERSTLCDPIHPGFLERYDAAYRQEMVEFVQSVLHGQPSRCTVEDAQHAAALARAAKQSLTTGKAVKVNYK